MGKILVIDDDLTTCNLLNKFLSKHGFTVITTTTAKKAIEYLKISVDKGEPEAIELMNTINTTR